MPETHAAYDAMHDAIAQLTKQVGTRVTLYLCDGKRIRNVKLVSLNREGFTYTVRVAAGKPKEFHLSEIARISRKNWQWSTPAGFLEEDDDDRA